MAPNGTTIAQHELCKHCSRNKISTSLDCGHRVSCSSCKYSIRRCPTCRLPVGPDAWKLCKNCKRSEVCAVLSCGHVASCNSCVRSITKCPICHTSLGIPKYNGVKFHR